MHQDTKAQLIDAAGSVGSTLLKEMFTRRQETKMLEQKAQYEKELAATRAGEDIEATNETKPSPTPASGPEPLLSEAAKKSREYEDLLSQAAEMESCDLCTQLIESATEKPAKRQAELLPQLRDFLEGVGDDTPTSEVAARVRDNDALLELMHDTMG